MALIKKIREKSGLAVGLVALGLGLFIVGGDILGPNSMLLGNQKTDVGEIAGETISLEQFQQQEEELKYNFVINFNRNPTDAEMFSIRQQAWDFLIVKTAFQKEFDRLGIVVTNEELVDMVQGNNVRPEIRQAFANPETGEFDRARIKQYLQSLKMASPQDQAAWYLFESNLKPSRLRIKYDHLMLSSNYVTDAEAERAYQRENTTAEVRYLYIPYSTISDSLVSVSESEMEKYLKANKEKYQVEESRNVSYVRFPIAPAKEDTAFLKQELVDIMDEFRNADDDSVFARINSDGQNFYGSYSVATLPEPLKANISNLSEGDIRGPYLADGAFTLYKVSSIGDDTVRAARASHILIRANGEGDAAKAEARAEAQRILNQIRGGADFAEMARQNSDDPSSSRGGDLGWFEEGAMVQPFEDAVFDARSAGLVNRVVETDYGFHIINVTEPATRKSFTLASIEREISPSDETRNSAYRQADRFASSVSNFDDFKAVAESDSLAVYTADDIRKNDRRINTLADARQVVMWLYNEASVGSVSDVFELDNEYVVVAMTKKVEAGLANLDQVRQQIRDEVRKQKQGELIMDKLKGLDGSLEDMAKAFGTDATVNSSSSINLGATVLGLSGTAPEAIGKAFALNEGEKTEPVTAENGVVVVELIALNEPAEPTSLAEYKEQIKQRREGSVSYYISEAIKEFSDIEDNRVRFF